MSIAAKYRHAAAVTPSDTVNLVRTSQALCIGVAGNIVVDTAGGEKQILIPVPAGILELGITRLYATNTTATGFALLWS